MPNYFNLDNGDIILSLILGGLFFIASYGVPFAVYFLGDKKVKEKQETLYTIIMVALLLQILACVLFMAFIVTLDLFANVSSVSSSINFSTSTMIFFAGDWADIDIGKIATYLSSSNTPPTTLGLLLMVKGVWIFLTLAYVGVPLFLIYKSVSGVLIKYKSDFSSGALYEICVDFAVALLGTFFLFAVHTQLPVIFMDYFYSSNKSTLESKLGSSQVRSYSYQGITGDYVRDSIDEIYQ
ncbi:hypothetical protein [Poseidonibacter ostreae]|uniref:Uncharacterized protein n=1 Tax=Poseidonibacter ostreae TaxID=2654171 RepID=A0A6L4WWT2_9BACT|nr:hypothetical protein [Poseidonibacter ostreae]KAB7891305.1 hypothetical protein GBG19_00280 [Poseidonibacter ostreae]